jgi:CRP/FNR family transcriptional regulator
MPSGSEHHRRLTDLIEEFCTEEWKTLMRERNTVLHFKEGQTIFKQGLTAEHMYMIKNGKVKVFSTVTPGIDRLVRLAADGEVLGHRGLGDDFTYTVTAEALTDTSLNIIPLSLFISVLKANGTFCYHFMLFMAEELRLSEHQMANFLNMTVVQRVAKAVKINVDAFGFATDDPTLLSYTISRAEIAQFAGTTYESVIRSLAQLSDKKVIEIVGKGIRVPSYQHLLEVIYPTVR